jgi:hypothetical protein
MTPEKDAAINSDSGPYVKYGQFSVLMYLIRQSILMAAQFKNRGNA